MFCAAFHKAIIIIIIIIIITPTLPKCKLKAIFVCLLLSGSLGLISLSVSLVCVIERLQSLHSSLICQMFEILFHLLSIACSSFTFSPCLRSSTSPPLSLIYTLLPLIYTLSSHPSSIVRSITPSHKWTVKIPSEYRSERALISNAQRMNKRWLPLS